ncbi:MAG: hypothetical protein AABM30_03305 [Actinomycetota bacterium]
MKPTCGSQGAHASTSIAFWLVLIGAASTAANAGIAIFTRAAAAVAEPTKWTFIVAAPAAVWIGAVIGALAAWAFVFSFWYERCLSSPDALDACSAGVVNATVPSFASTSEQVLAFTGQHARIDVVVKSIYWQLLGTNSAWIFCAGDPDMSPLIRSYYKSPEVCAAGAGATIGAGVGVVGGILLGCIAGAAIGCATIILCILAILVALLVAAVVVIVAAIIGGQIGKAAAGSSTPTASSGQSIAVADYVTTKGSIVNLDDDAGARVYWFVTDTTLHGRSTAAPQFSFRDPDANLNPDACPVVIL